MISYFVPLIPRMKRALNFKEKFIANLISREFGDSIHLVRMPHFMDEKNGSIDKWLVKEGDPLKEGSSLCQVTIGDISLEVESAGKGILAELLFKPQEKISVGEIIAKYVTTKEEYIDFLETQRLNLQDNSKYVDAKEAIIENSKRPDKKNSKRPGKNTLLKVIRNLISDGYIEEGSEFSKELQSLARERDDDLMSIFEASFEGSSFNSESFDRKFFLENSKEIIAERKSDE